RGGTGGLHGGGLPLLVAGGGGRRADRDCQDWITPRRRRPARDLAYHAGALAPPLLSRLSLDRRPAGRRLAALRHREVRPRRRDLRARLATAHASARSARSRRPALA